MQHNIDKESVLRNNLNREEPIISEDIEQYQSTANYLKTNLFKFYEQNKCTDVTIICGNQMSKNENIFDIFVLRKNNSFHGNT